MTDQRPFPDEERLSYARVQPGPPSGGTDIIMSLVSAGLFLYVGFGLGLVGISGDLLYDGSVTVLVWGARIVGVGILVVTALTHMRIPGADALDLVISVLATLMCLGVGLVWLVYSDWQGILLLLFGLLNGSAARHAWARWQSRRAFAAVQTFQDNDRSDH